MIFTNTKQRRLTLWTTIAVLPVLALALLRLTGQAYHPDTLDGAALETAILWTATWLVTLTAGWLLTTHLLTTYAYITRSHRLLRALDPITAPVVRRAAAQLLGVTLTINSLIPTVAHAALNDDADATDPQAAPVTAIYEPTLAGDDATPPPPVYIPRPAGDAATPTTTATPSTVPATTPHLPPAPADVDTQNKLVVAATTPTDWVVNQGDDLWTIANQHLTTTLQRTPTQPELSTYWATLVTHASPHLRSGDPDLIYPGETIPLPDLADAGLNT